MIKYNTDSVTVIKTAMYMSSCSPILNMLPNKNDRSSGWYPGEKDIRITPLAKDTGSNMPSILSIFNLLLL